MNAAVASPEDLELLASLQSAWRSELEREFGPLQKDIDGLKTQLRTLGQRVSRPPGAGDPTPLRTSMARALAGEQKFSAWLSAPRSSRSHYEAEVPFAVKSAYESKAVISGVGINEPYRGLYGPPQPKLRVGQLLPRVPITVGSGVSYTRETAFVPGADLVPETTLKPETTLTFANVTATFETVATYVKVSLQSLSDTPQMMTWIDNRLGYAVLLKEEDYLLNSAGGLLAAAGPIGVAYAPGAGATQLDYIGAAIGQLEASGYSPDGIILNGADASAARLLKTTTNEYIWADPDSPVGTSQMWSIPVVLSPSMTAGSFLVGAFQQGTILFSREALTVVVAYQNEDDFVRNLATIRGEERAAVTIPLPAALITGSFTGVARSR